MKTDKIWSKILQIGTVLIVLLGIIYFVISVPQLRNKYYAEAYSNQENEETLGELVNGTNVVQTITTHGDYIKGISVEFANYNVVPSGTVTITVKNEAGDILKKQKIDAEQLPDSEYFYIQFTEMVSLNYGEKLSVIFECEGGENGSAITLWSGETKDGCDLFINGERVNKTIIIQPDEYIKTNYAMEYWIYISILMGAFLTICLYHKKNCDKVCPLNEISQIFGKYKFLLSQLVGKEFKNKYRRSYLGIMWSLLNPLLMMVIVSSVFSFIFRFNIEKFPVYLILGQVTFNFFSEATQVSVSTITGSGQLIKKVYLPKYIFPVSKVLFSFVNFLISFIAVFIVMIFYKVTPNINMVFLPVWLLYYFVFTLGVSLFLAALMVMLRDTQYLYSLVIVAFGYLTPVFYPTDSLAPWMQKIINLNPLYHYIKYLRNIFLYGRCPSLADNVICLVLAVISFTIGMTYFFKKQKTFILYI